MNKENPWTDRFIEACWLVAIVAIPIYFNIATSRIFEPDKTLLLRSIAILMAGLWMVRLVLFGFSRRKKHGGQGSWFESHFGKKNRSAVLISVAVILLAISVGLSAALSVAPDKSFFGSYARGQGVLTFLANLIIFISIALLARRRTQIERIISAIVIASLPVAIYGVLQHFGTDPIPWGADTITRVSSTMGNPVFVAAYMIMAVPATLYRIHGLAYLISTRQITTRVPILVWFAAFLSFLLVLASWTISPKVGTAISGFCIVAWIGLSSRANISLSSAIRCALYIIILALQLTVTLFSQSRGPFLGLAVGFLFYGLILTIDRIRYRTRILIFLAILLTGLIGVLALRIPVVRGQLAEIPYIGRFADALSNTGTVRVRTLIWEGAANLVRADPGRVLAGHGPETMRLVYPSVFPPELALGGRRSAMPDRAHNEVLDIAAHRGLIGVLAYIFIIWALFYSILTIAGLQAGSHSAFKLLSFQITSVVVVTGTVVYFDASLRLAGLTLSAGLLLGFLAYVSLCRIRPLGSTRFRRLIACLILFALVAHIVESQFGFGIAATYLYFWIWAAIVPVLLSKEYDKEDGLFGISGSEERPEIVHQSTAQGKAKWKHVRSETLLAGLLTGLVLILLVSNFLRLESTELTATGITWLLVLSWAVLAGATAVDREREGAQLAVIQFALVSAAVLVLYVLINALSGIRGHDPGFQIASGLITVLIVVIGTGIVMRSTAPTERRRRLLPALVLCTIVLIGVGIVAYHIGYVPARADVSFNSGRVRARSESSRTMAIQQYQQAIEINPSEDHYYIFLGREWAEEAKRDTTDKRELYFRMAMQALQRAREISPLDVDHTSNLARLYDQWAATQPTSERRDSLYALALKEMNNAVSMSPWIPTLIAEAGGLALRANESDLAKRYLAQAVALDSTYVRPYLDLAAIHLQDDSLRAAYRILIRAESNATPSVEILEPLGYVESRLGMFQEASDHFSEAIRLNPAKIELYRNLIIAELELGDCDRIRLWLKRMQDQGIVKEASAIQSRVESVCEIAPETR